jgi:hypothetical protein
MNVYTINITRRRECLFWHLTSTLPTNALIRAKRQDGPSHKFVVSRLYILCVNIDSRGNGNMKEIVVK